MMEKEESGNAMRHWKDRLGSKTPAPTEEIPQWQGETRIVGKGLPRVDAYERVSGTALYTHDIILPGMLYMAILRCPHPHARVKKVDTSKAEGMPGVHAVFCDGSPGTDIAWPWVPWLPPGLPKQSRLFDDHCRYEGEEVAAAAAETPHQAWDALRAVEVEYELLPFVQDEESALAPEAPQIHESGNSCFVVFGKYSRGDVEKGFAEADVVVEESFSTSVQFHATMETHGSVVNWDGDKLTIWDSTQGVFETVQRMAAAALKKPLNKIRAVCKYMGGAFGSKAQLEKHTIIAALISRKLARPVKAILSREETFHCVGNRPNSEVTVKAGAKKDGTLTALSLTSHNSPGAYFEMVGTGFQISELYTCPNVKKQDSGYYTNTGPGRAMRAPGYPPCSWALEQVMDMLAEKLEMDPTELRLKNIPTFSQTYNLPYTSTGLRETISEGARVFGWSEAKARPKSKGHLRRGVGMASAVWQGGNGEPPVTAIVKMLLDGSVVISTGAMDIGTGTKTVACMTAAEELGLPLEKVSIENADTDTTPYCFISGGSRTLPGLTPAVRRAAWHVKQQLLDWAAEWLKVAKEELELQDGTVASRSDPKKKKSCSELIAAHQQWDIVGVGYRAPNPEGKAIYPFATHFAEVEVNTLTGEIKVLRMVGAHESGRVINRKTYDNQVFGGMTQGIGFGLMEQRVIDRPTGKVCNDNWHDFKVPTAMDVPVDHSVVAIDPNDTECNIVGCKGLGEPATIPTAAAIANAVYDAIGVRIVNGPIDPRRIIEQISKQRST